MKRIFLSLALTFSASICLRGQVIKFQEKPDSGNKWGVAIAKKFSEGGAVTIQDGEDGKKGIFRITNKGINERYIGLNFQIFGKTLQSLKNKPLRFKMLVKHVSGSSKLSTRMRAFKTGGKKWTFLMGTPPLLFKGEKDKWIPMELNCRIPDLPEINFVDFQTGVRPTSKEAEYLIDKVELEVLNDKAQANFASPLMCYAFRGDSEKIEILKDGKALAAIVTEEKPTRTVKYAVDELNRHIELCAGVKLPVLTEDKPFDGPKIFIGKTSVSERFGVSPECLAPDHWIIRSVGGNIVISGGDNNHELDPVSSVRAPFGTLYGVYEFLERFLGVRWYWPGKLGTVAPERKNLTLENINVQGAPSYKVRFCFYAVPNDPGISKDDIWKWWRRLRWGGVGGSPIGMHSFNSWPKRFAETHPEYFAVQTDGKPMTRGGHGVGGGHVCLSNPEVLKQTIEDKTEYFTKNKWRLYSPVMPGDSNSLYYCRCPECQAKINLKAGDRGRYSNAVWGFVNKVAEKIYKTSPGRFITCCAYGGYRDVPDFPLMPNVAVTLCMGRAGIPNNIYNPDGKKEYLDIIDSWQKTGASLYMWDYWDSPRRQKGVYGAPTIFPHAIKEYLLLDYGKVDGHVIELCEIDNQGVHGHNWSDWVYDSLNLYVGMRLLWDINSDTDKILNEFYTSFYGPGAPWIKKFYTEMEAAYENPDTKGGPDFKWYWETAWAKTYPNEFVKKVMGHLRKAVEATKGKEPYHSRALKTLQGFIPFEKISMKFSGINADDDKELEISTADKAPVIDGAPDDESWKKAVKTSKFTDSFKMYDLKADTEAMLLCDKDFLYILFKAFFPEGNALKMDLPDNSRDRFVWTDESCEIFLVQGHKKVQFLISPDNSLLDNYQMDYREKFKLEETLKWNCEGIKYATKIVDGKWTAELAIPLKSLGLEPPTKETPWKVNFTRNFYYKKNKDAKQWQNELSCWSPTFGSFHNIDRFGILYFKDNSKTGK